VDVMFDQNEPPFHVEAVLVPNLVGFLIDASVDIVDGIVRNPSRIFYSRYNVLNSNSLVAEFARAAKRMLIPKLVSSRENDGS